MKRHPLNLLGLLSVLPSMLSAGGCAYSGPQRADVSPLRRLVVVADIDSVIPLFPSAKVIAAGGMNLVVGGPQPDGVREMIRVEQIGRWRLPEVEATLTLYDSHAAAAAAFEFQARCFQPRRAGGAGTKLDRHCLSRVEEARDDWWHAGLGTYDSWALFQKRNLVVSVTESSEDKFARVKERLVAELAAALAKPRRKVANRGRVNGNNNAQYSVQGLRQNSIIDGFLAGFGGTGWRWRLRHNSVVGTFLAR